MRILAVRGENLASLAAPFEIDFCREPLASTGLFAITGETGAGKSTILDAICLALYGAYPRVAIDRRELAPDPSGKEISGQDARALLRRGAGKGYAEVDFLAADGQSYRVRWEALRARGRANGALQNELRSLIRIGENQAIASGKRDVLAKVQALTDFTFDQFRRTVLLAQGEFDAFLLAGENERAELLEKVTGTEIYAALSRRAHEETETRRKTLDSLEVRRAAIGLFDEPTRVSLAEERLSLAAEAKTIGAAIAALKERLEHHARIGLAREKCAEAASAHHAALLASTDVATERGFLGELDAVEPLRAKAAILAQAQERLARAEDTLVEASLASAQARETAMNAAAEREKAQALDLEAEDRFKALGPIWTRCEQLDEAIKHCVQEHEKAEALRAAAERSANACAGEIQRLDALHAQTIAARDRAAALLGACPERAVLCDRIQEVEELLQKRGALKSRYVETQEKCARATEEARRLVSLIAELNSSADRLRIERDRLGGESEARRSVLAAIGEEELRRRDRALGDLLGGLRDVANVLDRHVRAQDELVKSKAAAAAAVSDMAQARAQRAAAQAKLGTHKAARTEIVGLVDLADATVSPQAIQLRASLVAGEPCPVCGGADHPHAHQSDAGAVFVARIRVRRAELDRLIAGAASAVEAAEGALAGAAARHDAALRLGEAASADLQASKAAYAAAFEDLDQRRAALGFVEALPPAPEATLTPVLQLSALVGADREALAAPLSQAEALRADLDRLREAHGQAAETLERKLTELAAQRQALHAVEIERAGAEMSLRELRDRLLSIDRELDPFLRAGAFAPADVDHDADSVATRLKRLANDYRLLKASLAEDDAALRALEPMQAAAAEAARTSTATLETLTIDANARATVLQDTQIERAALIEGEPTSAHRTRHNEMRRQARASLDRAREAESDAGKLLAAAVHGASAAQADLEAAGLGLIECRQDFAAAVAETDFAIDHVQELLGTALALREGLRVKIDAIDKALSQAAASLGERQRDLDDLLARDAQEADPAALTAEITSLQDKADAAQRRSGAIENQLSQDNAARDSAAALAVEIEAAAADLAIWQAMDDAIGSASGDKFRRFAQGVTLEHLVALANRHLATLAPRYRLERAPVSDLSVHVVDRDMGNEKRAARSLSGGERFLVSLSLAIALSGLEGRQAFVDTLFVDEGFGSLDAETLDVAIDALESLHGQGRKVGVVTHVAAMVERIAVQVRVEKHGNGGRSTVRVTQAGIAALA